MEYIIEFIDEKCILHESVSDLSSRLYQGYKDYCQSRDKSTTWLSNKTFTQWFKNNKPDILIYRTSEGYKYKGLCLKENYQQPTKLKSLAYRKEKKKRNNHIYYEKHRDEILQKRRKKKDDVIIGREQDREFIERMDLRPRDLFSWRYNNLIVYSRNPDKSINWDETIRLSRLAYQRYLLDNQNKFEKMRGYVVKNKSDALENKKRILKISPCDESIKSYDKWIKECDKDIAKIDKKEISFNKKFQDMILSTDRNIKVQDDKKSFTLKIKKVAEDNNLSEVKNIDLKINEIITQKLPDYDLDNHDRDNYLEYETKILYILDEIDSLINNKLISDMQRLSLKQKINDINKHQDELFQSIQELYNE